MCCALPPSDLPAAPLPSPPTGSAGGKRPYRYIVVAEERWRARWVGGARKLCHALTNEVRPRDDPTNEEPVVLVLGLRDCRTPPKQAPRAVPILALLDLVGQASAGGPNPFDGGSTYADFPAGYDGLMKNK